MLLHFRRQESSTKPARTETTILFLPDVWSVMPTAKEFSQIKTIYEHALQMKLNPELAVVVKKDAVVKPKVKEEVVEKQVVNDVEVKEDPPVVVEGVKEEQKESEAANNEDVDGVSGSQETAEEESSEKMVRTRNLI